jgi:hypothetical protein
MPRPDSKTQLEALRQQQIELGRKIKEAEAEARRKEREKDERRPDHAFFEQTVFEPADVIRFEDGKLAEHWDVLQDEATQAESVSGLPMFGDRFPA